LDFRLSAAQVRLLLRLRSVYRQTTLNTRL